MMYSSARVNITEASAHDASPFYCCAWDAGRYITHKRRVPETADSDDFTAPRIILPTNV